ncbi:MAG TPA: iron-sulfur cluster assembly accessory protein [Vitreimonas sp.]|uniref:HesB/IscA family protein n=1 Tax=Vitreimonas sp. TaxID=3069702 RepID=UPI002D42B588|nr:iron-sulfur cluster assembly accessory protein [Vitreimonas sp.]HYD86832.1 iron-sulfur cluster assembly accessory protein [Vitreimonas sp.]
MASIALSATAADRIKTVVAGEPAGAGLRVAVEGGGCSGFQYEINVAQAPNTDDTIIERDGARLFVDPVSLPFLLGSEVDWVDELIGASFKVKNPNAASSCGCGVSFSV